MDATRKDSLQRGKYYKAVSHSERDYTFPSLIPDFSDLAEKEIGDPFRKFTTRFWYVCQNFEHRTLLNSLPETAATNTQ